MNTKILQGGETIHDFRPHKLTWGWNGLCWDVNADRKTATMLGIGNGLKAGHFIALNHGNGNVGHKIERIEYKSNPKDMFTAVVSGVYEFSKNELD